MSQYLVISDFIVNDNIRKHYFESDESEQCRLITIIMSLTKKDY